MAKKNEKNYDMPMRYQTTAEARTMAGDVPVFCAYDELVPIGKLIPHPHNPNTHPKDQIKLLAQIIKAQGWRAPITVSRRSGYIVRGHGRLLAAIENQAELVPVDYQNYASEAEEYADLIADNRLSELSEIDNTQLTNILAEMDTGEIPIVLTGYTEDDISELLAAVSGDGDSEDDQVDAVPDPEKMKLEISKPGDIWSLGLHRIICGDSTDPKVIERLMQGEKAQLVFTDPPVESEDLSARSLVPAFRNFMQHTEANAAFYIWHTSDKRHAVEEAMTIVGLLEKQYLIWTSGKTMNGKGDYRGAYESCFYAEKAGEKAKWCGDRAQSAGWNVCLRGPDGMATVLTGGVVITDGRGNRLFVSEKPPKGKKIRYARISDGSSVTLFSESKANDVWEVARETDVKRQTQKPVELAVRAIENSTEYGELVIDFFAGSHSTMIGAEMTGRRAYLCELEPKYIDVGILRYVKLKGTRGITCERDGKTYDFLDLCQHIADEHGVTIEGLIDGTYAIPDTESEDE